MRLGRAAGVTDTGRRRLRNEDAFICEPPLFAVADGMGGARAGEVAAGLAAAALEEAGAEVRGDTGLAALIEEANRRIWERSLSDPETAGMGAVVTAALVDSDAGTVTVGHVGDSRAYRIRDGAIEQLTTDHSLVAELIESGVLTPEEAERHPQRSAITRALGTEPGVSVDTLTVDAEPADLYLLCSDGLSIMLGEDEIIDIVAASDGDPAQAAESLVRAANAHGGEDNITVVLFEIVPDDGELEADRPTVDPAPTTTEEDASDDVQTELAGEHREHAEAEGADATPRRHGAGAGGRFAAILLIVAILGLALVLLYVGGGALTARGRELTGLVIASAIAGVAIASVTAARSAESSQSTVTYGLLFLAVYVAAHIVVRRTAPYADGGLLPLTAALTGVGLAVNYRLDSEDARRQALWVLIGVCVFAATLILLRHDYRVLESYRYLFGVAAVLLLLLPSVPGLGERVNGVRLWVNVPSPISGVGPLQFQPGELAKIFLILFLAGYLREKRELLAQGRLKDYGPLLAIWGAAMLVIVQTNDLGSALLNFGIFLAMLYVATGRAVLVAAGLALFVGGAALLYQALERVQERVTIWLQPWTDERVYCALNGQFEYRQDCASYQLVKSLYSIANGGFSGTGLGQGTFTSTDGSPLIPYLRTDFIYSAIAQELGLVGAAAVLLLFMLFVVRGMRVALRAEDGFSKLLATGLTFGFALQTFIIVGGVLRVVPLTGITLPFVSYGGSSILANFLLLAGLLLISNRANTPR